MLPNHTKRALQEGRSVVGSVLDQFHGPAVVRILASAGLDFLFIDTEHHNPGSDSLSMTIHTCRLSGITPLVRVADVEYHLIARTLDMGAQGIIVPRVESPEQARQVVAYSKFPPDGVRGFGSFVPLDFQAGDLAEAIPFLNAQTLITVQIETAKAVERVADILAVPGIDVAFVGPLDLSISLGIPGQTRHPRLVEAVQRVIAASQARGLAVGIFGAQPDDLLVWQERGVQFLTCNLVSSLLYERAREVCQRLSSPPS